MKNEEDLIHQNKLKWCHQNLSLVLANPAMTYNLSYFMTAYIFYDSVHILWQIRLQLQFQAISVPSDLSEGVSTYKLSN